MKTMKHSFNHERTLDPAMFGCWLDSKAKHCLIQKIILPEKPTKAADH